MKDYVYLLAFASNDIYNVIKNCLKGGCEYYNTLEINFVSEIIQELGAALFIVFLFAIYRRYKNESFSDTINKAIGKKKIKSVNELQKEIKEINEQLKKIEDEKPS